MVLCKAKDKAHSLPEIFAHSLGSGSKPIATITSHLDEEGNVIWYIGGNIAENGVGKEFNDLINEAESLLADIMPWFSLPELKWASHNINRAEPKQSGLTRPDTAFVESENNIHIAWPTKLALAPDLADTVINRLKQQKLVAGTHTSTALLPQAEIANTLWNTAFK